MRLTSLFDTSDAIGAIVAAMDCAFQTFSKDVKQLYCCAG